MSRLRLTPVSAVLLAGALFKLKVRFDRLER